MSEIEVIQSTLEKTARRRRWQRALGVAWHALFAGAALAGALMPIALLAGYWRKPTLIETARWVDHRKHFQERLSTALEVAASPKAGTWRDLVLSDAAGRAREFDAQKFLPFHLPRITRWAVLVLVLAAALGFVPEYRSRAYLQKKKEAAIIKDTGKQLAELTRRAIERRAPAMEPTQKALESVKELGEQMAKVSLSRTEALHDLASATEKLKDQTKDLAKDPALRKLEQVARSASVRTSSANADLQKQVESMQKQLGNPDATPDALDK